MRHPTIFMQKIAVIRMEIDFYIKTTINITIIHK